MADYQVVARKYRPQTFSEVLGQDAIVATLKNALRQRRLAHAYLFCGSRGTGKTTLARIFAKVINCPNASQTFEPCNQCPSCREITSGNSLDVLEIDGASHRGIEDIRQINETVGIAASSGQYKVYIIDEVHMLTKEAFNALLKTLEEPPPQVKFLFATTEPHKVLPTILSRCQRFNLRRLPLELIQQKLQREAGDLGVEIGEDALRIIAGAADGGMRDAESILDQMIAYSQGKITSAMVAEGLGYASKDQYFDFDRAVQAQDYKAAFEITHQVFSEGKDIPHFIEGLVDHYRTVLRLILAKQDHHHLSLPEDQRQRYIETASRTEVHHCLNVLDYLIEAQKEIKFASSQRMTLEGILLKVIRLHHQVPIEYILTRLQELEKSLDENPEAGLQQMPAPAAPPTPPAPPPQPKLEEAKPEPKADVAPTPAPVPAELPLEEPTPPPTPQATEKPEPTPAPQTPAAQPPAPPTPPPKAEAAKITTNHIEQQSRLDTLFQFAAVELGGNLRKAPIKRR